MGANQEAHSANTAEMREGTFRLSIGEFVDLEIAVGAMATDGGEEFELTRFADGAVALKVWRDGEASAFCRLADWTQGSV